MSVISFSDWKKKRSKEEAYTSAGNLREDVSLKEAYGFDLCTFIIEEINSGDADPGYIAMLWDDLHALVQSLPHEHAYHYFQAFISFRERDKQSCLLSLDLFFESERQLNSQIAQTDWWIEHFLWIFIPPYPGFYDACSELFLRHWPSCAMTWICKALEQNEQEPSSIDLTLKYLHLALQSEPDNTLAYYLLGMLYFDHQQWQNALINFKKAYLSDLYSNDPSFLFDFAWAAEKSGNFSQAITCYQQCIELDETYPCALNNLGCLQMRNGQNEEAFQTFSRAITLARTSEDLSFDVSMPIRNALTALERQKKWADAIAFVKRHNDFFESTAPTEIERLTLLEKTVNYLSPDVQQQLPNIFLQDVDSELGKQLTDQIIHEIKNNKQLFHRNLAIYEDEHGYGQQYYLLHAGVLDLLCYDTNDQTLLIIHAVDCLSSEADITPLLKQVQIVQQKLAKPNQSVLGILVCTDVHPLIKPLLHFDPFSRLEIYQFRPRFERFE